MKRARVTTRSEAARARARPCLVSPDALLALLDDADVTAGQLLAGSAAVASLTADMVTRKDDSVKLACGDVGAARAALAHSTKRVADCARRRARLTTKCADAAVELLSVTAKQLRVWGAPGPWDFVLEGAVVGCAVAATQVPQGTIAAVFSGMCDHLAELCLEGGVVTGDGLRVVSAAGPGLKWFEPHSRNEFSVVLAQAVGSVPVWLQASDVTVAVFLIASDTVCSAQGSPAATGTVSGSVESYGHCDGEVSVSYGGIADDIIRNISLQLSVCDVAVSGAASAGVCAGETDWCERVRRRPLSGHQSEAVGTHVATLAVVGVDVSCLAVSADEEWLVVGLIDEGTLSVYSLPGGSLVRTFGGRGAGPLQFCGLERLCFAPNGNICVVECVNKRLQEVMFGGVFVRFVGVGDFGDGYPVCVDVLEDVIAVGCCRGTGSRVVLFDFGTGTVTSRFGEVGTAPGHLSLRCIGIRFSHDGSHVIVAEHEAERLSLFTADGVFVRCVGVGILGGGFIDVLQTVSGEYVVADSRNHRVCVFSPDGTELVRSWGVEGAGDGEFKSPTALAAAGRHLYVMDDFGCKVQVFE